MPVISLLLTAPHQITRDNHADSTILIYSNTHNQNEWHWDISSTVFTQTPRIRLVMFVKKWLNPFLLFSLAQLCRICHLEKSRRHFREPFRIYNRDFSRVLLCSHHQLMVDDPVRLPLEKKIKLVSLMFSFINLIVLFFFFFG